MKLINNMTDLSNQEIGQIIDELGKMVDTIYYGKTVYTDFVIHKRKFRIQIKYLKRYVRFDIWEVRK